jgi:LIM domain kinase 1
MLECDDCGLRFELTALEYRCYTNHIHRTHVKCGEVAPRDCGTRPPRQGSPLSAISPLSRVKQNAANASEGVKPKSSR